MAMHRTQLPHAAEGVPRDGLALTVDGPPRPPLRFEVTDGRRMVLLQGEQVVLLARQRVTHFGVHYARTGHYVSPVAPLRADTARRHRDTHPDDDAWSLRWAHHFADALRASSNGPLHEGDWQLRPGMTAYAVDAFWDSLSHDPDIGHLAWFSGSPPTDSRDILALRPLSAPHTARVKAYRRQYREGTLPPVLLWGVSALDASVVLDGHDRLAAALAEGGRPAVLRLNRAGEEAVHQLYARPLLRAYEERITGLTADLAEGHPMAEVRIANAGRRLAGDLDAVYACSHLTRSWPLPGGAPAWQELAARHAPDWHPDTHI